MKKLLLVFSLSVLFFNTACAQNLLPNPDFEIKNSCPLSYSGGFFGGGYDCPLNATGWYQATDGTPDHFHVCDSVGSKVVGIPANAQGYQAAYSGYGYMGMYVYGCGVEFYREYIMAHIPTLERGATYEVSVKVSLSNRSHFATNGFGALFTTYGSPDTISYNAIAVSPQVSFNSYGIINDTTNWVSLTDTFIADDTYTTFIFGCFNNEATIQVDTLVTVVVINGSYAYYYIDSISLRKIKSTNALFNVNSNSATTKVYPNPFTENATITFSDQGTTPCDMAIYNAMGQEVLKVRNITGGDTRIDRNGLPTGLYYYRIKNETNVIGNGSFRIN